MAKTLHAYFVNLLEEHKISDEDAKKLQDARDEIKKALQPIHQYNPHIYYGGSYAKKTMIKDSFDLDIVVYFPHTDPDTPKTCYGYIYRVLTKAKYKVKKLVVSLRIDYDGFHIDVVVGKAEDDTFYYANLYDNIKKRKRRSSLKLHIDHARQYNQIIKIMKIWRLTNKLTWHKLAMESLIVEALKGKDTHDYGDCMQIVLSHIKSCITSKKFVDPSNSNNPIHVSDKQRQRIKKIANRSCSAWSAVNGEGIITGMVKCPICNVKVGFENIKRHLTQVHEIKGEIKEVWQKHNVTDNDRKGFNIHVKFENENLKGVACRAVAYFSRANGKRLEDENDKFCTLNGQVCASTSFTPGYENSVYKDLSIFMPISELHLAKGEHDCKFDVQLYVKNTSVTFAYSDDDSFTCTMG